MKLLHRDGLVLGLELPRFVIEQYNLTKLLVREIWQNKFQLFCVFQVGKGLSQDEKAQKLALQHWLEAVSPFNWFNLSCLSLLIR